MKEKLSKVLNRKSLTREEANFVMDQICDEKCSREMAAALIIALKMKTESVEEITGFVQSLRERSVKVPDMGKNIMDVCGTGGDSLGTFNVSTTVAFVVAACGQNIAKHGNRSVSSKCGSFDVLEALGVKISNTSPEIQESLDEFGLCFLFAPAFHPVLKNISSLRKNLSVSTVFNILGPLLNPMSVKRQVIGVYSLELVEKMTLVAQELGATEIMVVHGADGLDEFSISGPTHYSHLRHKVIKSHVVTPEECGLKSYPLDAIKGGAVEDNVKILINILEGEEGAKRDTVLLNAGAALVVGGLAQDIKEGVMRACHAIDSGKALKILNGMRKIS
jgi:anthranilate phosphoribosyltransferase